MNNCIGKLVAFDSTAQTLTIQVDVSELPASWTIGDEIHFKNETVSKAQYEMMVKQMDEYLKDTTPADLCRKMMEYGMKFRNPPHDKESSPTD